MLKKLKNFLFLVKEFSRNGKKFTIFLFLTSLSWPISTLIDTSIIKVIFDRLETNNNFFEIFKIIGLYFIIAVFLKLFSIIFERYSIVETTKIRYKMNRYIYNTALHTDIKYCDNPEFYNKYSWAVRDYYNRAIGSLNILVRSTGIIITILAIISIIGVLDPIVILFSIISVGLSLAVNIISNKINYKKNVEMMPLDRIDSYVHRVFYLQNYSMDLRSTGLCTFILNKYFQNTENKCKTHIKYRNISSFLSFLLQVIPFIVLFSTILYLSYKTSIGVITLGNLVLLVNASQNLTSNLFQITDIIPEIVQQSLYADKIIEFLNTKSEIEVKEGGYNLPNEACEISIKNLNFKYETDSKYVLKNINLQIMPKQKIAIVGRNGAGKSTLVKLLLRLYDASDGSILYNGKNIKEYNVRSLRNNICVAFQNSNIYSISLLENINLNNTDLQNQEKIPQVLSEIGLEKYNGCLNQEVTKEFNSNGLVFSGGEQQKLAIIRTLMRNFSLLIYDEPTSSLDPIAEYNLIRFIEKYTVNTTFIMIAHRLSTIRDFDLIYVMDNGRIIEYGNHNDLMNKRGLYYEMFTKQAENYVKNS